MTKPALEISAAWRILGTDFTEEISKNYCEVSYDAEFSVTIDGHTETRTVQGWISVGFLAGAHSDGGGWTKFDRDGQFTGLPSLELRETRDDKGYIDRVALAVNGGDNRPDELVELEDFPAVAELLAGMDTGDLVYEVTEEIVMRIIDAADDCASPCVDAPSADQVASDLDVDYDHPIVVGSWKGAGLVICWLTSKDEYKYAYWPDRSDVEKALEESREYREKLMASEMMAEIEKFSDE